MSRADSGVRRHRRNVRRHGDENTRAARARRRGSHINHRRCFRIVKNLDDFLGRIEQAPGSVELDYQADIVARARHLDRSGEITGSGRPDRAVNLD